MNGDTAEVSASSIVLITITPASSLPLLSSFPASSLIDDSLTALTSNFGKLRLLLLAGEAPDDACDSLRACSIEVDIRSLLVVMVVVVSGRLQQRITWGGRDKLHGPYKQQQERMKTVKTSSKNKKLSEVIYQHDRFNMVQHFLE